jgi:hypothetical protein
MAITVKKTFLWKKELDNHPGAMAEALEPLAEGGADLHLVMVYRFPDAHKGAIEVHPISGRKLISIAKSAGLAPSPVPEQTPFIKPAVAPSCKRRPRYLARKRLRARS